MIAVRIGPDIRMAVVGAPSYFADHQVPRTPRELAGHRCINYRHVRLGGLYAWDFEENGRPFEVRVEGRLLFNNGDLIREAALAGQGLAYVYEDEVTADIEGGRLMRDFGEVVSDLSRLRSLSPQPAADATRIVCAHWCASLQILSSGKTNTSAGPGQKSPNDLPSIHYSKCRDGIGEVDEIEDLPPTGFDVSWLGSSQQMFELGEDLFNRIEVWTVGRQEKQVRAFGTDGFAC